MYDLWTPEYLGLTLSSIRRFVRLLWNYTQFANVMHQSGALSFMTS